MPGVRRVKRCAFDRAENPVIGMSAPKHSQRSSFFVALATTRFEESTRGDSLHGVGGLNGTLAVITDTTGFPFASRPGV